MTVLIFWVRPKVVVVLPWPPLAGRNWLQLALPQLQTLVFITLVFSGQRKVYLV